MRARRLLIRLTRLIPPIRLIRPIHQQLMSLIRHIPPTLLIRLILLIRPDTQDYAVDVAAEIVAAALRETFPRRRGTPQSVN